MPQEGILPAEDKVRIVEEYLNGSGSPLAIQETYGITKQCLYEWVRQYKVRGAAGFTVPNVNRKYSVSLKRQSVEDYLSGAGSLRDICSKYDISRPVVLERWIKCYNSHGSFRQPKSGGVNYMAKGRDTTLEERIEIVSYCIANNKDYGKTIGHYGVSYNQIYGWVRRYETEGAAGLVDRRGKRKDEATMTEVEKLRAQIKLKEAENLRLQMENDLLKKLEELERRRGLV